MASMIAEAGDAGGLAQDLRFRAGFSCRGARRGSGRGCAISERGDAALSFAMNASSRDIAPVPRIVLRVARERRRVGSGGAAQHFGTVRRVDGAAVGARRRRWRIRRAAAPRRCRWLSRPPAPGQRPGPNMTFSRRSLRGLGKRVVFLERPSITRIARGSTTPQR